MIKYKIVYLRELYDSHTDIVKHDDLALKFLDIKFTIEKDEDTKNWFSIQSKDLVNDIVYKNLHTMNDEDLKQLVEYLPNNRELFNIVEDTKALELYKYKDSIDQRLLIEAIINKVNEDIKKLLHIGAIVPEPYYHLYNKKTGDKWQGSFRDFIPFYCFLYDTNTLSGVYKLFNGRLKSHKGWVIQ